nr:MAG TPA: hypothetical protein [Caudoviricetes sp.]
MADGAEEKFELNHVAGRNAVADGISTNFLMRQEKAGVSGRELANYSTAERTAERSQRNNLQSKN